ncbi:pectate lyase-like adhesive domain-containing protein [Enterococcus plantarum]|uniref:pectate lyase-like adhesive domain-containing protein n=1 Tax=Enterococcus plantarum TaxID=1077675 RepID=UPI001A8EC40E|nr:pectate lyase-like adhesive domain-containing protein [Enterococcus plantarum]MBO0423746.1 hypothetical protein [Enterococcus plantarum]
MKRKKTIFFLVGLITSLCVYLYLGAPLIKADEMTQSTTEMSAAIKSSETSMSKENDTTIDSEQSMKEPIQPRMENIEAYELTANGTGIVAKNIAKTMTDIQGYNGDIAAIKQMILKETGAKAYGLSGGSVVDVTDSIQVSDLKGLETVSSNDLQEFHLTLTVPETQSGTGSALSSDVIVYIGNVAKVSNWSQLDAALMSNTVTIVDVQSSMTNTATGRADRNLSDNRPNYVLLGNGYSLDFIGYSYRWGTNTSIVHKAVVDNVDLYGGHYYGPVTMWDRNAYGSSITYRNVNYTGSQLTASFQAVLRFEGKNVIKSKATQYTSYNGTVRNMADTNQSGLESHTLVFASNTDTTIEAENGDGVILGSWYSNYDTVATIQPSLTLEENATATIRTLGNTGETNSWQTNGGSIPSVISVQRNGKIDVGKNANLNVETADGTTRVPVRLGYQAATSQWTTSINLEDSSNFNVTINGPISNTNSRAGFMLQQNSAINVGDNAEMVINANQMTTGAPVISMGQNAKFDVAQKGSLVLNKNGGTGRLLDLSTGSKFQVKDQGVTKFISTNEGASTSSMIYGGSGSSFIIGDKGTFESVIKDGTGVRNMLDFGSNTTFQFSNAQKIDLDSRGNTNVNLINMTNPGTFTADIQEVSAWSKADASQATPTFHWTPMYGMSIKYNGTTTTSVVGNSITNAIQKSFVDNYRTENFSRIVYDYIPDVLVGFDQPSDNKALESGQKLTGTVNNNALMLFYLVTDESDPSTDVLLTTPTVTSPIEGDTRKFNTIADNNGKFTFDLPSSVTLKAGQKIKAYAWLDGKDSYALQTVADKTPPEGESVNYQVALNGPTPTADKFVKNPTDSNPTPQNFTYAFNAETPQSTVEGFMSQIGEHTVKVDLFDEAGNKTTIVSKLTVNKVIDGSDFNAPYKDIRDLSDDQLKSYILEQSQSTAYKIVDGQKTDISSLIKVTDFGGLNETENLRPKAYPVTLTIKAADSGLATDISITINVTVVDMDAVLRVEFVNEANQVLSGYTVTINTIVGNTVDLTTNDAVQTQVENVTAAGYDIAERPANENAITIDNTAVTVQYKLQGVLSLTSVPNALDFGTLTYDARTKRVEDPSFDEQLVVTDTRADAKNGWRMTASLSTPMRNSEGQELVNALRYMNQGKETILSQDAQVIYTNTKGTAGSYAISDGWGKTSDTDGIKLQINSSDTVYTGDYVGVITWKVMAGQP